MKMIALALTLMAATAGSSLMLPAGMPAERTATEATTIDFYSLRREARGAMERLSAIRENRLAVATTL